MPGALCGAGGQQVHTQVGTPELRLIDQAPDHAIHLCMSTKADPYLTWSMASPCVAANVSCCCRMVRVLVSTACLQARRKTAVKPAMLENSSPTTGVALQQSMDSPEKLALETDALLSICVARDRLLTGVPAPAEGLCLAEVGYEGYLAPR